MTRGRGMGGRANGLSVCSMQQEFPQFRCCGGCGCCGCSLATPSKADDVVRVEVVAAVADDATASKLQLQLQPAPAPAFSSYACQSFSSWLHHLFLQLSSSRLISQNLINVFAIRELRPEGIFHKYSWATFFVFGFLAFYFY